MAGTRIAVARRLVVKVGSALVTNNGEGLDLGAISEWARQIADLRLAGRQIVLVSSGAIACGLRRLGWSKPAQEPLIFRCSLGLLNKSVGFVK